MNVNLFRSKMAEAGYNQGRLAKAVGMSPNTLSAKLCGKSTFDVEEINRICCTLSIIDGRLKADIFLA